MRVIEYKDAGIVIKPGMSAGKIYIDDREMQLIDVINFVISESQQHKSEVFVAFCGLKCVKMLILNILHQEGYIYRNDINKNDMRVGNIRGRFAGGNCFYIQIKTGYKSFVTLQATETVTGLKKPCGSIDELKEALALYHYTRDSFLAGVQKSETRILYSSATISRTAFNRENPKYQMDPIKWRKHITWNGQSIAGNEFLEKWMRPGIHGGYNDRSYSSLSYTGDGIVLDVNSLYPYIACNSILPGTTIVKIGHGEPEKEFVRHKGLYYTFEKVTVSAKLKDNGIACIQADGNVFADKNYLTEMKKRKLTLSESDRKMLFDNYDITYYKIDSYVIFRAQKTDFTKYLTGLYKKKVSAKDDIKRSFYKLMINGLIGTFAKQPYKDKYSVSEKNGVYVIENILLTPEEQEKEQKKATGLLYINMAIVSEARRYIVNQIKKHYDRWLYTDTDSLHLKGKEIPADITISDDMGAFKIEHSFIRCRYKDLKSYILVSDAGQIEMTTAGIPKEILSYQDKSVDLAYIRKCVRKKHIDGLYEKPLVSYQLTEDLGSLEVSYKKVRVWLSSSVIHKKSKMEIYREKRAGWDYYNGQEMDRELYDRYGRQAKMRYYIEKWNRTRAGKTYTDADGTKHGYTFEECVEFLRSHVK